MRYVVPIDHYELDDLRFQNRPWVSLIIVQNRNHVLDVVLYILIPKLDLGSSILKAIPVDSRCNDQVEHNDHFLPLFVRVLEIHVHVVLLEMGHDFGDFFRPGLTEFSYKLETCFSSCLFVMLFQVQLYECIFIWVEFLQIFFSECQILQNKVIEKWL